MAKVIRTALGDAMVDCLLSIPFHHPEVKVLHFCLMPDHLHAVLYVHRHMPTGIKAVVRGFWQASKKLGRAWTVAASSFVPIVIREKPKEANTLHGANDEGLRHLKESSARLTAMASTSFTKMSRPHVL